MPSILVKKEILFIDSAVEEYQSLMAGAKPSIEIIILDSELDGICQIAQVLSRCTDISSIHIVSHGKLGSLQLGSTSLSPDNLAVYTEALQQWKSALTPDADILLYGCNVASGEIGKTFVNELSQLTGANIAASDDLTGSAALGGDWEFEVTTGQIETDLAFSPGVIASYSFVLEAPVVSNNNITVDEGTVVTVTSAMLGVTDADTAAASLTYTLTSLPTTGVVKLNGTNVALKGTFTQDDINNGRLTFTHNGSETTSDSFGFVIGDSPSTITRVSVATDGTQSNNFSPYDSAISADGRYVTFTSFASNLVSGDTNSTEDIFLYDRNTGVTTRVSQGMGGTQSINGSYNPAISADGRYVTFSSSSFNLVSGDTNGRTDIFLYDRNTGVTTRVSQGTGGTQSNGGSGYSSISADGRYVTFSSSASNLVGGDTNSTEDIFLYDRNTGVTTRVSQGTSGIQSNNASSAPTISADGRYVTFSSSASNLVSGDTNGVADIFLYDRNTGMTTRVSQGTSGIQSNNASSAPTISADGRYVTFSSSASNLVSGDTNSVADIFLYDRNTGVTTRVSQGTGGTQSNGGSYNPSISADGRYVTFSSSASNLVGGDTNSTEDIFLYDRNTGVTTRVSQGTSGIQSNNASSAPTISADGRYVTFSSSASNLVSGDTNGVTDIFIATSPTLVDSSATVTINPVNDAPTITVIGNQTIDEDTPTNAISFTIGDAETAVGNLTVTGTSSNTGLIPNGNISFSGTGATRTLTLTPAANQFGTATITVNVTDANGTTTPQTFEVNVNSVNDAPVVTNSNIAVNEGTAVTVTSAMLGVSDADTAPTSLIYTLTSLPTTGVVKLNGTNVALKGTFTQDDINNGRLTFTHNGSETTSDGFGFSVSDGASRTITRISVATDGTQSNSESYRPSISADGRYITFESNANNLVSGDTNNNDDIFLYDRITGTTTRISGGTGDTESNGYSYEPMFSGDGRYVTFQSSASNLVSGDTNDATDIFLYDRITGETTRASQGTGGIQSNSDSYDPAISADGRYVAFQSSAYNLVNGDTNDANDIFLYDRITGETTLVSQGVGGIQSNDSSHNALLSGDGRYVAFASFASNLVSEDTNGATDIFLYDRITGETTLVSQGVSGTQSNGDSYALSSISADGRYVTFASFASNLVNGDTNGVTDVFLYDRDTGKTTLISQGMSGTQSNGGSYNSSISADGRYVIFDSSASNLVSGDTNGQSDIFLYDRTTGVTTRLLQGMGGIQSNDSSYAAMSSDDGSYVTFLSHASNLVNGDTNGKLDIFVASTVVSGTATVSINPVNDAPTITTIGNQTIDEDTPTHTISFTIGDAETAVGNLTITGTSSNPSLIPDGNISFSGTGATRTLTLTPTANQFGTATITVNVTDANGTTTPQNFEVNVNSVNDAPILNNSGTPTLTAIDEDPTSNNGTLVSTLLATGAGGNPIADADTGAVEGIAVTGVNNTNGTWQYSINSGNNWLDFSVSSTSATLLRDTALVRFVPNADFNGTVTNGITFRAWDGSDGRSSGTTGINPGVGGGSTAFSPLSESTSITVNPVDDPGFTLTPISGNTTEGGGIASFTLKLNTRPTADVTLNFSSSDTTEGQLVTNSLTFTSDNWNTAQTVTVRGVDDVLFDGNVAYKIVTAAVSADSNYNNLNPIDVTVTNTENDIPLGRVISGTTASETLGGTSRAERIYGYRGYDRLVGGFGNDQIFGGAGKDTLIGDITNVLAGSTLGMNDLILGGMGNDSIYGCGGDDLLYGEAGNDSIWGNDGNDRLWGGTGNDLLTGGAGIDTFVLARGEGIDTIQDFQIGEDKIGLAGGMSSSQLSITQQGSLTRIADTVTGKTLANLTGVNAATLIADSANSFVAI